MKKILLFISTLSVLFVITSCNDLSQNVHTEIVEDNFYETERQVLAAAGPVYSGLRGYVQVDNFWGMQELTSDELVLPTRGAHWYNDGMFQRFQRHAWHTEEGNINNMWNFIFSGVNTANRLLYQFGAIEEKSEALELIIRELRGIRAFYYSLALDTFGNVPIVTDFEDADAAPPTNSRQEVFDFVEQELLAAIPELREDVNTSTYGRFHKWAGYMTLAKLYLNAGVYTGQSRYQDALEAVNAIIDAGRFSLADNYFSNFVVENQDSPENMFVIPFDHVYTDAWGSMFQPHFWTLHFVGNQTFNMQQGAWNGFAGVPSFVNSYDEDDLRKQIWLTGQQYSASGEMLYCNQERAGEPLVYTMEISSLENAYENEGARLVKYDYTNARDWSLSNDYTVYRYADVLLMKAEILMRMNGGSATQEAVDLVNEVRRRAFNDPTGKLFTTGSLTMDALLAERGRELAGEAFRRSDQIRFGTFTTGSWTFKEPSGEHRALFPIPQQQLNSNPNLTQNPGY